MQTSRKLVSEYRETWEAVIRGTAPVGDLDRFFNVPCLMVSLDGAMTHYTSRSDVTAFNLSRLDAFRAGGVHFATLRAVDVVSQGPHVTLAIVNWELLREDGSLERAWRHYYTILEPADAGGATIIVSGFQTGS